MCPYLPLKSHLANSPFTLYHYVSYQFLRTTEPLHGKENWDKDWTWGLYYLDQLERMSCNSVFLSSYDPCINVLGTLRIKYLFSLGKNKFCNANNCLIFRLDKQTRLTFFFRNFLSKFSFEMLYVDIWGLQCHIYFRRTILSRDSR